MTTDVFLLLSMFGFCGCKVRVVDLTHTIGYDTIHWPGTPAFNFTILSRQRTPGGFWLESNYFGIAEHSGTHLDAPAHFNPGGLRASELPLDRLTGPGVVIDIRNKIRNNADYEVSIEDLRDWENKYGVIPEKGVVVLNCGWSKRYPNTSLVFNTRFSHNPRTFRYPGWHRNAVRWLINNRGIHILGTDTPSNDCGQCFEFWVHRILAENGVSGLEFLANLESIPVIGATIYAPVIKLRDGSGGPTRAFATFEDGENTSGVDSCLFGCDYWTCILFYLLTYIFHNDSSITWSQRD